MPTANSHQAEEQNLPLVTVIVPVFNQPAHLEACLEALSQQTYPRSQTQVIVIDNGSEPGVQEVCRSFAWVTLEVENRPGSYAARNRGIKVARGDVIAFTDADCVPSPDWLLLGVKRLLAHGASCGLVAGRIELYVGEQASAAVVYEQFTAFPQEKYVLQEKFGATANLFTRSDVLEAVGPFNGELSSGGDKEWGNRVHAAGYEVVYADDVWVHHPPRGTVGQLVKKMRRVAGGLHYLHRDSGYLLRNARRLYLPPLSLLQGIARDPTLTLGLKFKVIAVSFFLRLVMLSEILRLSLGGERNRA